MSSYGDPTLFDDVPRLLRAFRRWRDDRARRIRYGQQQALRRQERRGRHRQTEDAP